MLNNIVLLAILHAYTIYGNSNPTKIYFIIKKHFFVLHITDINILTAMVLHMNCYAYNYNALAEIIPK